jgi:hypothetical protein
MIVGCEYAGKTTLANEIVKWTERTIGGGRGGGRGFHNHFSIPSPELTPEGWKQMPAASVEIKEMFQRYVIQYHMNHSFYSHPDTTWWGSTSRTTSTAPCITASTPSTRTAVFAHEEKELMREAPQSILLLLRASPDAIRRRMKDDPHEYQVVQEGDVETVLERFEASAIRRKFALYTTSAKVEETLSEFEAQVHEYLTEADRLRILTNQALGG